MRRAVPSLLLAGLAACCAGAHAQELLLDVKVNGQKLAEVVPAQKLPDGRLALPAAAFEEMRMPPPSERVALLGGVMGYALEALPGLLYTLDSKKLALDITAPPALFSARSLAPASGTLARAARPSPGVLVNYDAVASTGSQSGVAATAEAVVFGPLGSFTTGALVSSNPMGARKVQRLDTAWQTDFPDRMETLVIGDTVGTGGGWSRPVRYGGVRYGRDFSLQPGFVTQPQASLKGSAALPSAVEVLVNGQQRMSQAVTPGSFEVSNVPLVSGAGEVNLVVRDLLGRETVVRQSYYSSPTLLAPGVSDYQVEAGKLRNGYGTDSDGYGDAFVTGTYRKGLTPEVTAEVRGEVLKLRQAAGIEVSSLLGDFAAVRAVLAASRTPERTGMRWGGSIERSSASGGWSLQVDGFSSGFTPFGAAADETLPRGRIQLGLYRPLWGGATGALTYASQKSWNAPTASVLGAMVSMPMPHKSSLSLSYSRQMGANPGWRAGMALAVALDDGTGITSSLDRNGDGHFSALVQASQSVPAGPGLGWYLKAGNGEATLTGGASLNTLRADFSAEAERGRDGDTAARLGMRGSVGWLGGLGFASRPLGRDGFAVVQVGDLEGVPVLRSHQVVAQTGAGGLALVPGLRPYQSNRIEIDISELPLDVRVERPLLDLVPAARSGVVADFKLSRNRSALVQLLQEDGSPVPPGAKVDLGGESETFTVARRGEVYLTGYTPGSAITVRWGNEQCQTRLPMAGTEADRLGTLGCFARAAL